MARTRHGRQRGFAAIPNATIDDAPRLDFMALGLLTVLLRQKDGWDITLERVGKKYGYGREALANAMGLLQVARYVVKVRIQQAGTAQWRTEIITYDTPASPGEVDTLLTEIAGEPGVQDVQIIPPTPSARTRARSRWEKLAKGEYPGAEEPQAEPSAGFPAVGGTDQVDTDNKGEAECRVSRQSAHPAVTKKTVLEENSLPLSPSHGGEPPAEVAPPGGAGGGEEEEISLLDELGFASDEPKEGPQRPSPASAAPSAPSVSDEDEIVRQTPVQKPAICRACWKPFPRTLGAAVKLCENCR